MAGQNGHKPVNDVDFHALLSDVRENPTPIGAEMPRDRFIKGTLWDDKAIAIGQKIMTAIAIFFVLCILHLVLERALTPKIYTPIRVWLPAIAWFVIVIPKRHPFALGWMGWLGTYAIAGTTCGYLWLHLQQLIGQR